MALGTSDARVAPSAALSGDIVMLLYRPLVISAMVGCIASAWVAVAQFFSPYWQGAYLVLATMWLTLQTLVSEQLAQRVLRPGQRVPVRVAEVVLAALGLRPLMYLQRGLPALRADASTWMRRPTAFFGDIEYLVGLLVMAGLWLVGLDIAKALQNLADPYTRTDERQRELAHLGGRFVAGALFLLSAAAVVHLRLPPQAILPRPVQKDALTWLPLLYVGLGMLLFGQARYALLRARWQREDIPVAPTLGQRWANWGLLSITVVCVLAALLPAGTTEMGVLLFLWLSFLLAAVGGLLLFVLQLALYMLLFPLLFLFRGGDAPLARQPQPPALPALPPLATDASPAWWVYLRLTVFWLAVAAVVLWLVRRLVSHWKELGAWSRLRQGLLSWLASLWRTLRNWWYGIRERTAARRGADVASGPGTPLAEAGAWVPWKASTERERVRRLYLLLLQRAQRVGAGRAPYQSPYEYERDLAARVSGEEEALDGLTEAFVGARYSQRDFQPEETRLLRQWYDRLRRRLRQP